MLNELSKTKTAVVFAVEPSAFKLDDSNVGRANEVTKNRIINIRKRSKSSCLILIFLILDFCHSFKQDGVLNSTFLILRKFKKCKIIGIDAAKSPKRIVGLRNTIKLNSF